MPEQAIVGLDITQEALISDLVRRNVTRSHDRIGQLQTGVLPIRPGMTGAGRHHHHHEMLTAGRLHRGRILAFGDPIRLDANVRSGGQLGTGHRSGQVQSRWLQPAAQIQVPTVNLVRLLLDQFLLLNRVTPAEAPQQVLDQIPTVPGPDTHADQEQDDQNLAQRQRTMLPRRDRLVLKHVDPTELGVGVVASAFHYRTAVVA
jgi:hypothetical protein